MYKALIFDLDGTAIPNKREGMPTDELVSLVGELRKKIKVCAATGRPWTGARAIIKKLGLDDPCIISGGTQVIDPVGEKILWEKGLDEFQTKAVMEIAAAHPYHVFLSDEQVSVPAKEKIARKTERVIYIEPVDKAGTGVLLEQLRQVPDITAHKIISWTPDHFDIHITDAEATKSHALHVLLEILGVHGSEVVAAGDGNNDLPLFEIAAYKIAMENGSEELKSKADMIAPSVAEDGLRTALKNVFASYI